MVGETPPNYLIYKLLFSWPEGVLQVFLREHRHRREVSGETCERCAERLRTALAAYYESLPRRRDFGEVFLFRY